MSNGLDPDLGPNTLQRLSAANKERVKQFAECCKCYVKERWPNSSYQNILKTKSNFTVYHYKLQKVCHFSFEVMGIVIR